MLTKLWNWIKKSLLTKVETEIEIEHVIRLDRTVYDKIEQQITGMTSQVPTNELEAGFALGANHALKVLREGYVIGA